MKKINKDLQVQLEKVIYWKNKVYCNNFFIQAIKPVNSDSKTFSCYDAKRELPEPKQAFNFSNASLLLQNPLFLSMPKDYVFGSTISCTSTLTASQSIQANIANLNVKNNKITNGSIAASVELPSNTLARIDETMRPTTIPKFKKVFEHGPSNVRFRTVFSRCVPLSTESDFIDSNSGNEYYYPNTSININPSNINSSILNNTFSITSTSI